MEREPRGWSMGDSQRSSVREIFMVYGPVLPIWSRSAILHTWQRSMEQRWGATRRDSPMTSIPRVTFFIGFDYGAPRSDYIENWAQLVQGFPEALRMF